MGMPGTLKERIAIRDLTEMVDPILLRYRVTAEEVEGERRLPHLVAARREIAKALHEELGWSTAAIGEFLKRDAGTIWSYLNPRDRR